jgi:uncharacterized protein (TIGR03083 family)
VTDPGIVADSSAAALTAQLDEVWSSLETLGRSLPDSEWTLPTPCPGWPVAAQYAHVIGTESMLLGRPNPTVDPGQPEHVRNQIGGFNEAWVVSLAGLPRSAVLDQLAEVTAERRQALAKMTEEDFSAPSWTPVGQADYRRFMQIRVFDCWVHEQDVRDAVGRPGHEAGPAVEQSVDEIVRALGYLVGKKAGAPDGSSVRFELTGPVERQVDVAVEGRARVVESIDGSPSVTLTVPTPTFTRLACGRVEPSSAADIGIAGEEALGRRVVESLPFTI